MPQLIYGQPIRQHAPLQTVALYLVLLHFIKRELETLMVHRFSHSTMPFRNLFKNSFHYWILSGVLLAYDVYSPSYAQRHMQETLTGYHYALMGVWLWAQLSNLWTHLILRWLRPPGTKVRAIPRGYGFDAPFHLTSPNYFFEAVGWASLVALTRSWGGMVFLVAAVAQMFVWAVKKHKQYVKEFDKYPRKRKAMFPYVA
jgi:very-long-chain enoyl-CoA reductase